jgi:hypothetical protein
MGGGGLSPGGAAGIGVGATLGLLALVGLGFFLGRRSAQRRKGTDNFGGGQSGTNIYNTVWNSPTSYTMGLMASKPPAELPTQLVSELPTQLDARPTGRVIFQAK